MADGRLDARRAALDDELAFWTREAALRGAFADEIARRLDPANRPGEHPAFAVPDVVAWAVRRTGVPRPRVVDLGSGPLSVLAAAHERGAVDVVAIDPLADEYAQLIAERGWDYPVIPSAGSGEALVDVVGRDAVSVVYCRNALDHAASPRRCLTQVRDALRPGGLFLVEGVAFEGTHQNHEGLHGHDLFVADGALRCRDRNGDVDIAVDGLVPFVAVPDASTETARAPEWFWVAYHKPPATPDADYAADLAVLGEAMRNAVTPR